VLPEAFCLLSGALKHARFIVSGGAGTTTVNASSFFKGMMTTALGDHDLLTSIEIPARESGQGAAYVKFTHPASRYAVIGVAAAVTVSGGKCTSAAVAVGGLVPRPMRAPALEKALAGQTLSGDTIANAARLVVQDLGDEILGDIYASAEYRKAVVPVWVKRALTAAAGRAR